MIRIGRLNSDDRAAWEGLFRGYIAFYERVLPDEGYDRAWREFLDDRRMHALVARLDGQLVGIAHVLVQPSTSSDDTLYLQDLFTAPAARGKGVGRALIAAAAEYGRSRGCCRLHWLTHETNATARRLYDGVAENRGFIRYQMEL